ncbi:CCHC-type domain-containing protein [Citrus sinensis]|uniref:CCHC-type domain-containing protein n=1 Tax=Citrus sinensis TaxID=2711 RepID=A0ACB8IKK5_CITSI|nr:CCHC-type domain-containing protein [Citrus sinensis]
MSLNSKAMNALFCALDKKEFHRVSNCESANEIWKKIEVVYEGTNQVKECKISRFTRQYEMFQMESYESVHDVYTGFTNIVNSLEALGKTFSHCENVKKIIRSLPKKWKPKRTAIEEAKNLNTLSLDDLIGSLISYEEDIANERIDKDKKKKSFAFKSSIVESDDDGSDFEDEGIEMITRKFKRILKKQIKRRKFKDLMRENLKVKKGKKQPIVCFECKKPGHIRSECPLLNKLKKKVMVATWDDNDEEDSQEVSNLALVAIRDDELDEVNDLPTYDELYDAFKGLYDEWMKTSKKNACLKKKMVELINENESLNAKITCL